MVTPVDPKSVKSSTADELALESKPEQIKQTNIKIDIHKI